MAAAVIRSGAGCPKCGKSLALPPGAGEYACRSCRTSFSYLRLDPRPERGPVPLPATAGGATCAKHVRNAAVASCERCGVFTCELCRLQTDGKVLCPACFDRLAASGELASARKLIRNDGGQALGYGVVSLIFPFFGLLFAPIAIWIGLRGRKAERIMQERVFGWRLPVGIGLGVASILLYGIMLAVIAVKAASR